MLIVYSYVLFVVVVMSMSMELFCLFNYYQSS